MQLPHKKDKLSSCCSKFRKATPLPIILIELVCLSSCYSSLSHIQDINLDHSNVEKQLKDRASAEAKTAAASLAAAEAQISSMRGELEFARELSEVQQSKLRTQLLQQQQQTMLAEAAAEDAKAARAVEKLTDERNCLLKQKQMLQEMHDQLQVQHEQQVLELQVERDRVLKQSLEISELHSELAAANAQSAKLLIAQVCSSSRDFYVKLLLIFRKSSRNFSTMQPKMPLLPRKWAFLFRIKCRK
jgi:hypothetical protein